MLILRPKEGLFIEPNKLGYVLPHSNVHSIFRQTVGVYCLRLGYYTDRFTILRITFDTRRMIMNADKVDQVDRE